MSKSKICFVPGPIHLFWITGIYFYFDLKDDYDIILIVGSEYKNNQQFKNISHLFYTVYYLNDDQKNLFLRHRNFYNVAKTIITNHEPKFVFQHNHVYPFDIYLFNMSRCTGAFNISFQIGFQHKDPKAEHMILKSRRINMSHQYSRLKLPFWAIFFRVTLKEFISYYKNYYLIPILITGKTLLTPFDPFTHSIKKGSNRNRHYDLHLVPSLGDAIKTKTENVINILQIKYPVSDNYLNVQRMLYGNLERNKKSIIILPDGAVSDYMFIKGKRSENELIKYLSDTWKEVIEILQKKFNNHAVGIKIHPAQKDDRIWNKVILKLKLAFPDLTVYNPSEDATRLIIESRIIVAEASTILWFAKNLEKEKILISLNLFNQLLSDAYSNEQGILYFKSLEELNRYDFQKANSFVEIISEQLTLKSLLIELEKIGVNGVLESKT